MTTVKVGQSYFCAAGHANFSTFGNDIVCAAASTLAYTFLNVLQERGYLVKHEEEDGYIKIYFCPEAKTILEVIITGYLMLEENYPENVKVVIEGVETGKSDFI